ncbi:MAG TPA: hypothetical protein ENI34_06070 [candidate division WOR-3 bacterium]|uniref:Uncharacterized protein n=1 Tax=candidate division WOR-3 bacterium TaxID=2052148 RepID=A0A9C9EMS9_UNCW3|nr:hypothetical protein [candidate division WOR-3 bacterium]
MNKGEILPATPIDDPAQKDRLLALKKLSHSKIEPATIKRAIRKECHGPWIEKALDVWQIEAYDSACLYFWNRAMADLRTKVMAYGKEHLEAIIKKEIHDERDLINILDDKNLIDHCFELGIISEEAWFFLHKAREIRNHYSLAHQFDALLDPIEALNIIKNCIKYVLAHQVPSPGINLKNLLKKLQTEDVSSSISEFEATYREQSSKIVNITLNRLFDDFIKEKSNHIYINNILTLAPVLWELADSSTKSRIGRVIAKLRTEADSMANKQALIFIKKVDGFKFVPESIRVAIFTSAAEKLYEACQGIDNFHNEPRYAKELYELGDVIPSSAIDQCTRAVFLSYIGNQYGCSWGAEYYNKQMIKSWNSQNISSLMDALDNDLIIIGRLDSEGPASRFKNVLHMIIDVPRDKRIDKKIDMYEKMNTKALAKHFFNKYTSKFKKR